MSRSSPLLPSSQQSGSGGGKMMTHEGFVLMQNKIETQKGENMILRQKLQSKSEALLILSKELEKARVDCDDYKELTNRLQTKYSNLKNGQLNIALGKQSETFNSRTFRDRSIAKHLSELRDDNKKLLSERDNLRALLKDREEDVKLTRDQLVQERRKAHDSQLMQRSADHFCPRSRDTDELVKRLERLQLKYSALKSDLQSLLDEKEDLVQERDSYKCKVHRLNHSMSALLKCDGYKTIDLDWLLAENTFLRDNLNNAIEEKQLANDMGRRYKSALEKSKRIGSTSSMKDEENQKLLEEITRLIRKTSFPCPPGLNLKSSDSLQELSLSLLETLNDRMTQLKHQRRSNKHILERLTAIQDKIRSTYGESVGDLILGPSEVLMRGYSNATVDEEAPKNDEMESALDEIDAKVNAFSRQSSSIADDSSDCGSGGSSGHIFISKTNHLNSPDVSDLYKKFQNLANSGSDGGSCSGEVVSNPPDIITENVPRRGELRSKIEDSEEEVEQDNDDEDSIVLPEHLQNMVDQAMKDLLDQSQ